MYETASYLRDLRDIILIISMIIVGLSFISVTIERYLKSEKYNVPFHLSHINPHDFFDVWIVILQSITFGFFLPLFFTVFSMHFILSGIFSFLFIILSYILNPSFGTWLINQKKWKIFIFLLLNLITGAAFIYRSYHLGVINNIDNILNELTEIAGGASRGHLIGRPHFAAFLLKNKLVKNINQAFIRYLGVGKPLYVPKEGLFFDEAAEIIRESGGIPILAHPISLYIAWGRLPDFIKILKDMGLAGLEAWHPTAKPGSCRRLEALAESLGIYVTEGSDYHGSFRPDRLLGYSGKGRAINDSILEAIPELKDTI